jgi:HlyD family secretion protein
VVSRLNVEVGENVITGTMNNPGTVILTVADLSALEVRADVDETDVVRVLVGQRARLRVDALPDTSFHGTVTEVASAGKRTGAGVDEATDFEVTVRFDEPVSEVRPEMTAEVEITTAERDSVLCVPISAVVARDRKDLEKADGKDKAKEEETPESEEPDDGSAKKRADLVVGVFVVEEQKARFVPVRAGISDDHHTEILGAALAPGSKVIVGPYATLRTLKPGKAVKPAKKASSNRRGS